jgi:hypothetical protein
MSRAPNPPITTDEMFDEVARVARKHRMSPDEALLTVLAVGAHKLIQARAGYRRRQKGSLLRYRQPPTPSERQAMSYGLELAQSGVNAALTTEDDEDGDAL